MAIVKWSWLGDPLAIDLANTVRRRGWRYTELIRSPADLGDWLDHERGRLAVPGEAVRDDVREDGLDDDLVARFLALRDHALELLRAAASGRPRAAAAAQAVNALVLAAPAARLLSDDPGGYRTQPAAPADPGARLLGDLAAAVVDLLTGPDAAQLTLCDAPGCGQLYLRHRPNQQWCNPLCGTRARSGRHSSRPDRPAS
jgi:predicted RNA-binding Zn ribbon-like protein